MPGSHGRGHLLDTFPTTVASFQHHINVLCPHVSDHSMITPSFIAIVKFRHHWQLFLTKKFSVERFRFQMDHDSCSSGYSEVS